MEEVVRTPEEHLEWVRIHHPDFYEAYKATLEKKGAVNKPMWKRSNGQLIPIEEMNQWHISASMNIVHNYTLQLMEETKLPYERCVPPIYEHLKEEMESRGMSIPKIPE